MKRIIDFKRLKQLREERGFTQTQMSKLLNMTQSNYSKLENGSRKIDSLGAFQNWADALDMPVDRLMSILSEDNPPIVHAGIDSKELMDIIKVLEKNPMREDEFVLFTTPVLEINKHDFKKYYPETNWEELPDDEFEFRPWEYIEPIVLMSADMIEVGMDYEGEDVSTITLWLGGKQLGIITEEYSPLVREMILKALISRVVLIPNEYANRGFLSTYMKAAFIITNAVCRTLEFVEGRFKSLRLLTKEEIEEIDG